MNVFSFRSSSRLSRQARIAPLALIALCALQNRAHAHQKWLWPNVFTADKAPVWVSFDVTWSDQPFTADQGAGEHPLWVIAPDGERLQPSQVLIGKTKTTAEIELTKPGTYRLEAVDPSTYWTRVGVGDNEQWIQKPKSEVRSGKITRADLYYGEAAAYITVGEPTELAQVDEKDPIEIRPKTHPSQISAGGAIELEVISYGKPVAKAKLSVFGPSATGHDPDRVLHCDERGLAKTQLEIAGRYLFSCELEQHVTDDPKADIHSYNAYLTLSVTENEK